MRISNQPNLAPWLNWIEQPPPKGQVTGSNPVGVTKAEIVEVSDAANDSAEPILLKNSS